MDVKHYSFTVGNVTCAMLRDGGSVIGREGILKRYPDASEADYERAFAEIGLTLEQAESSLNILLVRLGMEVVLIDAGEGGRPRGGLLPESLRGVGLRPEDITRVVITHTHGDHVQGLLTADHTPVFLNATYIISTPELAFWQGRIAQGAGEHGVILAMMQARGLHPIGMDEAILPGMQAVPIPGHTPGQIAVLVESEGEKLIHMADLLHSPMQFAHPEWSPSFDADTSVSVPTRRAVLGRAADDGMLAAFYHLPFPGLGRVSRAGAAFAWEAVPG
ncbi:MAG: MBL fold metallo-hydrolase [Anaerolineae bacterium]|nr:MBL fold metallo-hydrolase [Anaerolineae bacterium]